MLPLIEGRRQVEFSTDVPIAFLSTFDASIAAMSSTPIQINYISTRMQTFTNLKVKNCFGETEECKTKWSESVKNSMLNVGSFHAVFEPSFSSSSSCDI